MKTSNKTYIVVKLFVEGLHKWEDAASFFPEVSYLSNLHRHMFHMECIKEVSHQDRDIEIIKFKKQIKDFLFEEYFDSTFRCCNFQGMSCEMIAHVLVDKFLLSSCKILEDGENGAAVVAESVKFEN